MSNASGAGLQISSSLLNDRLAIRAIDDEGALIFARDDRRGHLGTSILDDIYDATAVGHRAAAKEFPKQASQLAGGCPQKLRLIVTFISLSLKTDRLYATTVVTRR